MKKRSYCLIVAGIAVLLLAFFATGQVAKNGNSGEGSFPSSASSKAELTKSSGKKIAPKRLDIGRLREFASRSTYTTAESEDLQNLFLDSILAYAGDPEDLLDVFKESPHFAEARLSFAAAWVEVDPDASFSWLQRHEDSDGILMVYESVGEKLGKLNPYKGIELKDRVSAGWFRQEYAKALVLGWMTEDFNAALSWAGSLSQESTRNEALIPLLYDWSQRDPEAAINYVNNRIEAGSFQTEAHVNIMSQWLQNEREEAERWIDSLPSGMLKKQLGSLATKEAG